MKIRILHLMPLVLFTFIGYSQVTSNGGPFNRWMGLNPSAGFNSIRSIGFGGNFSGTGGSVPQARLHLSDFGWDFPANGSVVQGRLFRTDGLFNTNNSWSIFTGTTAGNALERFRILSLANSSNIDFQITQSDGRMAFQTGTAATNTRLFIQRGTLPVVNGVNTAGFIAIYGNSAIADRLEPRAPLHVFGSQRANAQGWQRGILLSNNAILQWDGGDQVGFFIAHPSDSPSGNMFGGRVGSNVVNNLEVNAPVDYSYSISVNSPIPVTSTINPLGSWNFFKNVLVSQVGVGAVTSANQRRLGVNTLTPQNVVEINTAAGSSIPGSSGLRLTDLRSNSTLLPNPGAGVLSVDANGDVVYVPGSTFGASCSSALPAAGAITSDTKVNLNNFNIYFTNTGTVGKNRVAIGYDCSSILQAKFNVFQRELASLSISTKATYAENRDIATVNDLQFIGVQGVSQGNQTVGRVSNIGGTFLGVNAASNYGVQGFATNGTYLNSSRSFGGDFQASNGSTAIGVRANSYGGSTYNYGLQAIATSAGTSSQVYGVYALGVGGSTTRAGYFAGIIEGTSTPIFGSDQQFKTNVTGLDNSLKILSLLKPHAYYFDTVSYSRFNFSSKLQFGYIAQEVEQLLPNLVYNSVLPAELDSIGNEISPSITYKSLNYNAFISLNTQAIIELNQKVDRATLSDQGTKTNVQELSGASSLDKVMQMRGVSFDWNHNAYPEMNLDSANHIGFIAQEIAQIDSRLTFMGDDSLLHIEYDKVVPILAEAITELNNRMDSIPANSANNSNDSLMSLIQNLQIENTNQQTEIDNLNNRLNNLENCLGALLPALCQLNQSLIQNNTVEQQEKVRAQIAVTLSNKDAIILDQNVPNPFAEQTTINFTIPQSVVKAQILFYNGEGRLISAVDVTDRGLGSLTVFGSDLSSGLYTYTLVADGKVVATKKMVKQ